MHEASAKLSQAASAEQNDTDEESNIGSPATGADDNDMEAGSNSSSPVEIAKGEDIEEDSAKKISDTVIEEGTQGKHEYENHLEEE